MAIVVRFGREGKIKQAYCTATEQVGDFVYIITPQGGLPEYPEGYDHVRRADPLSVNRLPAVGVIIYKEPTAHPSGSYICKVQYDGETPPIFNDLEVGRVYFLHLNASISRNAPYPPPGYQKSVVQSVAVATASNRILVRPTNVLIWRVAD